MENPSQPERNSDEGKRAVTQLMQIKYIFVAMLGLAVFGRTGDWNTNLAVAAMVLLVYTVENSFGQLSGAIGRLVSIRRRRKAAAAESERRMRRLMKDLEQAEKQALSE